MDSAIRFGKMCFLLGLARVRGASIIWTAHNLYPHDRNVWPLLDRLARQIVVRLAAHIFVHGPAAAKIVAAEFPAARNKLTEIWHGHWLDFYPRGCSQNEARARLGIPADVYVYGCVGACKEYKNLHKLIPAFQSVPGAAWLIIAGRFQSAEYEREVKRLVAVNPERILVVSGFIPDEDLQYFLAASNIVVMPYAEILTSGSAMLALSFGRPVIAPRRGFLEDVIVPDVGLLYDMNDHAGLVAAMIEAQRQTFNKK